MKIAVRLFAVSIISIGIALVLSLLPDWQQRLQDGQGDVYVFGELNRTAVGEQNMVDWMLAAPLQLQIKRVEWDERILLVEFDAGAPLQPAELIYEQLVDFVYYSLAGTTNIDRVWVRVVQPGAAGDGGRYQLLAALDARRNELGGEHIHDWRQRGKEAAAWLNEHFTLTVTPQGRLLLPALVY